MLSLYLYSVNYFFLSAYIFYSLHLTLDPCYYKRACYLGRVTLNTCFYIHVDNTVLKIISD